LIELIARHPDRAEAGPHDSIEEHE
jgi:hypothetical protein